MAVWNEIVCTCFFFHLLYEMTFLDVFQRGWHIVNVVYPPFLCITHMPPNLKRNTQNYLKGKWWLLVADNLQMTVSFYLHTLFQGKTEGVRDLKSDTSAYLLERVFLLSKGLRAECFFLSFFFFCVILHRCAPPSSLKTMHILPGEFSNITTLFHRYSSLGPHTFSHPFATTPHFLFSALPPFFLLVCLPIRRPSFHVLPTP